ncbi:MAG: alpha/beta hydrolase [Oscillospiraceae bacterium]|nr:alpha/beta hydrolase [Oscillospiraceae bacterium]
MLFWILAILLLAVAIITWLCLRTAVLRAYVPDFTSPKLLKNTHLRPMIPLIEESRVWLSQQEKEDWYVKSHDGLRLHGIFVPKKNAVGTLLFFHGYRSAYWIDFAGGMKFYHDLGYNLLICEQRAHGKSEGLYLTFGVKERKDVTVWTEEAASRLGNDHPLLLAGVSMGATTVLMASALPHKGNVRGVIADCGFTSPKDIVRHVAKEKMHLPPKIATWFLGLLTRMFCGFRLDECSTVDALQNCPYPVFFIHGKEDKFVPCAMTERNYEAFRGKKEILLAEGAGHGVSFIYDRQGYEEALQRFLKHCSE